MLNTAQRSDLTLTPWPKVYDGFIGALLANNLYGPPGFAADEPTIDDDGTPALQVVSLTIRPDFEAAVARWLDDTMFDSLPDMMRDHDSFAQIIAGGERAVPLIAAHLRRSPSFLFLALEAITGENPVPKEAYGNLRATVAAWLQWLQR